MTNMSEEQRVAYEACVRLRVRFRQPGGYGAHISWLFRPDRWNNTLIYYLPAVRRLYVMVDERKRVICFGLDCAFPTDHFLGDSDRESDEELLGGLRFLAEAYQINYECVLLTDEEIEQEFSHEE